MTPDPSDNSFSKQELLEYLLGALDPGRTVQLERALVTSEELGRRLASCRAGLPSLPPVDTRSRWRLPPTGHVPRDRLYRGDVRLVAALGPGALRPRDQFEVVVGQVLDAERRRVVVLYRQVGASWTVLHPETPEDDAPLSAFPAGPEGNRTLVFTAQPDLGTQDWAVALPDLEPHPAWDQPPEVRWAPVRRAVTEGRAPVYRFQVEVAG